MRPRLLALTLGLAAASAAGRATPAAAQARPAAGTSAGTSAGARAGARYQRPGDADLQKRLTPIQYSVTRRGDTEPPFKNAYWDNHRDGLYVDLVSGVPLFSSKDKFESGTGWPSFTRPLDPAAVKTVTDRAFGMERTEVRGFLSDSHLGHVFDDGPAPTGKRFCMNSAALRFVPAERLRAEGYGAYAAQFERPAGAGPKPAPRRAG